MSTVTEKILNTGVAPAVVLEDKTQRLACY